MTTSEWTRCTDSTPHGWAMNRSVEGAYHVELYDSPRDGCLWRLWSDFPVNPETGHARASLLAYCEREGITLPPLPEEWCPEPVEGPGKPYSLADDPRLREVVRTVHGDAMWIIEERGAWLYIGGNDSGDYIATVQSSGAWEAYNHGDGRHGRSTNPANAYDEAMAALRDLGSLVDEEPATPTQPPTLRDRLLNLSTRMWLSDKPAAYYADELRDLAREMGGGGQ